MVFRLGNDLPGHIPPTTMKPLLLIFCALTASRLYIVSARAEEKAIPQGYTAERYSALWERSPFTIASAADAAPAEPVAAKLVLAGVVKIGSDDIVTLLNKDSQERILVTQTPNAQGYKLVSVEQNSDPLKVVATLQKGTESIKVRFDPSQFVVQSSSQPQPPGQNPLPNANLPGMPVPARSLPLGSQPVMPGSPERVVRRPPIPLPVIPNRQSAVPPLPKP